MSTPTKQVPASNPAKASTSAPASKTDEGVTVPKTDASASPKVEIDYNALTTTDVDSLGRAPRGGADLSKTPFPKWLADSAEVKTAYKDPKGVDRWRGKVKQIVVPVAAAKQTENLLRLAAKQAKVGLGFNVTKDATNATITFRAQSAKFTKKNPAPVVETPTA